MGTAVAITCNGHGQAGIWQVRLLPEKSLLPQRKIKNKQKSSPYEVFLSQGLFPAQFQLLLLLLNDTVLICVKQLFQLCNTFL